MKCSFFGAPQRRLPNVRRSDGTIGASSATSAASGSPALQFILLSVVPGPVAWLAAMETPRTGAQRSAPALCTRVRRVQQMICHHLKKYIGHEFSSTITGITDFGLFAEIDNFYVSGLIHVADLPGDRYFYDKDANLLKGKRTGRVYRLGQDIKIKIMNVLPSERKITLIPC